ncbi:MAG TPA: gliding motility-associated C-terminal domain-containing protein [Chitinophagales bacterium]|nr:gliding motility-associated C-terminal domain-containing protein [Chitinophagales bacterium]
MKKTLHYILGIFYFTFSCHIHAQNYTVLGNAGQLNGCECFRITPDAGNQAGAIFQNKTINLNNSFDFTFSVYFGCHNGGGADGLMFVLTTNPNGLGNTGEGLGYAGNNQPFSFAVEFDTYQNSSVNDPSYHHIAFNSGGQYSHNVAGPVPALPSSASIDDCQYHTVRIVWDVNSNTYSVYLDGTLRLSTVIPNIVQTYFGGNPIVNWGWTAATGGGTNEQNVCVQSISNWVAGINYQSCNLNMQFQDVSTSNAGTIQSWAWNFGDGGTSALQNPTHTYAVADTYNVTLTITDISSCTKSYSHTITIAPNITLTPTLQQPPCNGGSNGNITVAPSGGFGASAGYGGYKYNWSTGQTTATAVGVTAGTYTVTVTDGVCTTTGQYTLNQPTPLTATVTKTDPNCNLANGTATVTVSGGTTPYQYVNWPGLSSTNVASGLGAGTFIPDFKDANGCSSLLQYSATLTNLPCGIQSSTTTTNVTCFNGTNGAATLNVTGGGSSKNINWSNGGSGTTISNLAAGTYTYNYSDNLGNIFSGSVTITQPSAAMSASLTSLDLSCAGKNDGSIIASVTSGGSPNYTYTWSGGLPGNPTQNNLAAGNYSVTITDSKNCTATASGSVSAPPPLVLNITNTVDSCFQAGKGTATANVTGGTTPYLYQWSNIASAQTNLDLDAGNYSVTVTDNKGCTTTGNTTIAQSPAITYTLTPQDINCTGAATGSIQVNVNGGVPTYSYTWNPSTANGNNPQNLTAGKYIVTISDAYNCKKIDSVTLVQPDSALVATSSHTNVTCFGLNNGTLTINVAGGTQPYSYQGNPIPPGTSTLPNLAPNTYAGIITDSKGCKDTITETITEPTQLTVGEQHGNVLCFGGNNANIDITVSGGTPNYTYTWNDSITTEDRSNLTQGNYAVTITDANNCTANITVNITEPTELLASETHQNISCFGGNNGSIDVTVSGGTTPYTFIWNDGNTNEDRTSLTQGNYSVTITDANNCTKTLSITISEPTQLVVTSSHTNVTCFGLNDGTLTINVSGGTQPYSYLGNSIPVGASTLPSFSPNTYTAIIIDANNCSDTITETITEPTQLTLGEQHIDASCFGNNNGSIDVTVNGGTPTYTYHWNDSTTTEDRATLTQGNYSITVTDANNCTATISATINEPAGVPLSVSAADANCFGANGSATASPSVGQSPYTYQWSAGNSTTAIAALPAGNYTVTSTATDGCKQIGSFAIAEPTQISITNTSNNLKCNGDNSGSIKVSASGGVGNLSFTWNPNVSSTDSASQLAAGTYNIIVTDGNNCTSTNTVTLNEPTTLQLTAFPTATTCNGLSDGSILSNATGGTPTFTYTATNNTNNYTSANGIFSNLAAGVYTVVATDVNGCTVSAALTINEPTAVSYTLNNTDATCYRYSDGIIEVIPSGGTPGYRLLRDGMDSSTSGIYTNLAAGSYYIEVTDMNGCSATFTTQISQPDSIILSATPNPLSTPLGNPMDINVTSNQAGNIIYSWLPQTGLNCYDCDNPIFNGISSIEYTVLVTTANGCTASVPLSATVVPDYTVYTPNFFTPNNDGSNDIFKVLGNKKAVKEFSLKIFNRWGEKVFEGNDMEDGWDGFANGSLAQPGVYVYEMKIVWIDNFNRNNFKGTITLVR